MSTSSTVDSLLEKIGILQGASSGKTAAKQEAGAEMAEDLPSACGSLDLGQAPIRTRDTKPSQPREQQAALPVQVTGPQSAGSPASIPQTKAPHSSSTQANHGMEDRPNEFVPRAPNDLREAGLYPGEVAGLAIKFLLNRAHETGFRIAQQLGLKFPIVESLLRGLKNERLVVYKNSAAGGDYVYELTELGRERAKSLNEQLTYFGTAPVPLNQYIASVHAQSIAGRKPHLNEIRKAFADLCLDEHLLSNVGQAIHSGRGMFLFGPPGNGKTSMAERITKSFGDCIWIPKAISANGEIVRLYDPNRHVLSPPTKEEAKYADGRYVKIERPTIIAGGELRMENLEITYIRKTGLGEAPLQMKANCGTLLIDDFGRQRMPVDELLNRWIVPLEQRHDFLQLESGRTIQVPFDELIVFSSNLEPRDLVDDAFLRRIPYKLEIKNPTTRQFRELFLSLAKRMGFACEPETVDYLMEQHYQEDVREMRFCHPRDLLRQVENRCTLHELPKIVTVEALDQAIENYFSIM